MAEKNKAPRRLILATCQVCRGWTGAAVDDDSKELREDIMGWLRRGDLLMTIEADLFRTCSTLTACSCGSGEWQILLAKSRDKEQKMMLRCIKNVYCTLFGRGRRDDCRHDNNALMKDVESIMETVEDVKQNLRAAVELAKTAISGLSVVDEKIKALRDKAANGLTVTQADVEELGTLSTSVKDSLSQIVSDVSEADVDATPPADAPVEAPPADAPAEPVTE